MFKVKRAKYEIDRLKGKTSLLHARNITKYGFDFHPNVSLVSGILVLLFIGGAIGFPEEAKELIGGLNTSLTNNFSWFFVIAMNLFLFFSIYLMFSSFGEIRLGGPSAKPEFSNFAWYSMLFSAGMGIGLVFWSVGEPIFHLLSAPEMFPGGGIGSALGVTFFHWGFHPWGLYALISLGLAFFAYNRGLPLSLRSIFYPILKDKIFGVIGDIIDIISVIACLFGLATSLGLGAQQINAGFGYVFGVEQSQTFQILTIAIITLMATMSVVSGLDKGVRILSELNMKVAGIFMLIILIVGPTVYILFAFNSGVGTFLSEFVNMSFYTSSEPAAWQGGWTIFYWGWWISYAPFVGIFIARISKGRTVREFIGAVIFIPTLLSFIWMAVFGGTAIFQTLDSTVLSDAVNNDVSTSLFVMIEGLSIPLWLKSGLSVAGIFLVVSFFVTSSDSGSLVVDGLTSGGKLDSPVPQRVFWAVMEGAIAIALLIAGGKEALNLLQMGVVMTGFPFAILLIIMVYSLHKGLQVDLKKLKVYREDKFAATLFSERIKYEWPQKKGIKKESIPEEVKK